jgi:hypothetical protein
VRDGVSNSGQSNATTSITSFINRIELKRRNSVSKLGKLSTVPIASSMLSVANTKFSIDQNQFDEQFPSRRRGNLD